MAKDKVLETAISPEYVKKWGTVEALRELLQNYIDVRSAFGCNGHVKLAGNNVEVRDYGPGIEVKHLALGISQKGADAIGQFGEGLKLAMLVFAREGRNIVVRSRDYELRPLLEHGNYGTPTLVYRVREGLPLIEGTIIRAQASPEEVAKAKEFFPLNFRTKVRLDWVVPNKISMPGGKVYINGSYIGELPDNRKALFSYFLNGDQARDILTRDRNIVDTSQMYTQINHMVNDIEVKKLLPWITGVLASIIESKDYFSMTFESDITPNTYRWSCKEKAMVLSLWKKIAGNNAIISIGGREDALAERLGHRPILVNSYPWRYALSNAGVLNSIETLKEKDAKDFVEVVPLKSLSKKERHNLTIAKKVVTEYYSDPGNIKIAASLEEACGVANNRNYDGNVVLGMYSRREDKIYIALSTLESLEKTLMTLTHETIHKVTKSEDLTEKFQAEQDRLLGKLMLRLAQGGDGDTVDYIAGGGAPSTPPYKAQKGNG